MKRYVFLFSILLLAAISSIRPVNWPEWCNRNNGAAFGVGVAILYFSWVKAEQSYYKKVFAEDRPRGGVDSWETNSPDTPAGAMTRGMKKGRKSYYAILAFGTVGSLFCAGLTKAVLDRYSEAS